MLKVKYFKHPHIAHYLYDRYLAAYGRLPWNDEVPVYFAQIFYTELFLGMKPKYNDLPSKFFCPGKVDCMTIRVLNEMWSCLALSRHW